MSDAIGRGITVTEIAPMDQPIDARVHTMAAFIGRALRGPLNTPILIENFATFCRRFGGVWLQSSLGPAVQQFFEHGGRQLYIVRVANGARGAMVCLPGHHSVLVLRALEPGSTERIRAAVDYDGITITTPTTVIEAGVRVTYHATVMSGVRLAEGSMLGAFAVATKDTEPHGIYAGIPARKIKDKPGGSSRPPAPDPLADPPG